MKSAVIVCVLLGVAYAISQDGWQERTIGGNYAQRNQFPYVVSIREYYLKNLKCGGTIIHPKWILTAATCFNSYETDIKSLMVVAGELFRDEVNSNVQYRYVKQLITHPQSYLPDKPSDIALIEVRDPFELTEAVKPATLPQSYEEFSGSAVVASYGVNSLSLRDYPLQLLYLEMPIINYQECDALLKEIGRYPYDVQVPQICTLPSKVGQSSCYGDYGNGLVQNGILIGILKASDHQCGQQLTEPSPFLYTGVSYYLSFISKHVR